MPNTNTPTDEDDYVSGTKGADVLTGGAGKDQFSFHTDYPNDFNRDTLDDGDRITDYEFEEEIDITGVRLGPRNVSLEYDATNNQTRLKLDLDKTGLLTAPSFLTVTSAASFRSMPIAVRPRRRRSKSNRPHKPA
jgi:hypothetical protein